MPSRTSLRARSGVVIGVKPSRHQHVDGVALQGQLQQHGLVLEEVEAVAGHAGAGLEIHQVELLGQFARGPAAGSRTSAAASCRGTVRGSTCRPRRSARRGATGWESAGGARPARRRVASSSRLHGLRLLAELAAFFLAGLALGRVLGLADRLRDLVRLAIELLDLDLQEPCGVSSSCTKRSTSTFTPRLAQFCLTSSAFSTMNLRSSMGSGQGLGIGD